MTATDVTRSTLPPLPLVPLTGGDSGMRPRDTMQRLRHAGHCMTEPRRGAAPRRGVATMRDTTKAGRLPHPAFRAPQVWCGRPGRAPRVSGRSFRR